MSRYYILPKLDTGEILARYDSSLGYSYIPTEAIEVDEEVFKASMTKGDSWVYDAISGGLTPKPPKPLQDQLSEAKFRKVLELSTKYLASNNEPIQYLGTTFDADDAAKSNLKDVLTAYSITTFPSGFFWVDANNLQVPVAYSNLEELAKVIADRGWVLFQKLQRLKSKTKVAVTLEEVETIIW